MVALGTPCPCDQAFVSRISFQLDARARARRLARVEDHGETQSLVELASGALMASAKEGTAIESFDRPLGWEYPVFVEKRVMRLFRRDPGAVHLRVLRGRHGAGGHVQGLSRERPDWGNEDDFVVQPRPGHRGQVALGAVEPGVPRIRHPRESTCLV